MKRRAGSRHCLLGEVEEVVCSRARSKNDDVNYRYKTRRCDRNFVSVFISFLFQDVESSIFFPEG